MSRILTNEQFVNEINKLITKWGGTNSDLSLTPDEANDVINDRVFNTKMQELINVAPTGGSTNQSIYIDADGVSNDNNTITISNATKTPTECLEMVNNGIDNMIFRLKVAYDDEGITTILYLHYLGFVIIDDRIFGAIFSEFSSNEEIKVVAYANSNDWIGTRISIGSNTDPD